MATWFFLAAGCGGAAALTLCCRSRDCAAAQRLHHQSGHACARSRTQLRRRLWLTERQAKNQCKHGSSSTHLGGAATSSRMRSRNPKQALTSIYDRIKPDGAPVDLVAPTGGRCISPSFSLCRAELYPRHAGSSSITARCYSKLLHGMHAISSASCATNAPGQSAMRRPFFKATLNSCLVLLYGYPQAVHQRDTAKWPQKLSVASTRSDRKVRLTYNNFYCAPKPGLCTPLFHNRKYRIKGRARNIENSANSRRPATVGNR
nr:uncharacterized protein LOC126546114 isoform X2 [Dermacentor andersoni]